MFNAFAQWTTQLNQTSPIAFAIVTVLTMVAIGVGIAMTAEFILTRLSGNKGGAPEHHGH